MTAAVWDTYVTKKDGTVMHFDIIVSSKMKDTDAIHGFGKDYLKTKGQEGQTLTAKECKFCHTGAVTPEQEAAIAQNGYFIYEIQNCD